MTDAHIIINDLGKYLTMHMSTGHNLKVYKKKVLFFDSFCNEPQFIIPNRILCLNSFFTTLYIEGYQSFNYPVIHQTLVAIEEISHRLDVHLEVRIPVKLGSGNLSDCVFTTRIFKLTNDRTQLDFDTGDTKLSRIHWSLPITDEENIWIEVLETFFPSISESLIKKIHLITPHPEKLESHRADVTQVLEEMKGESNG